MRTENEMPDDGHFACELIRRRLGELSPEMTFRVGPTPGSGTVGAGTKVPHTIEILGQRTRNISPRRANSFIAVELVGEDYYHAQHDGGADDLLRAVVAQIDKALKKVGQ